MDAPPVGENWRGGVRKCACLAEDCSTSLLLLFLYLCHVMPFIIRQQHGQSRSADVALMCLILCSVAATLISLCLSVCVCFCYKEVLLELTFSPRFVSKSKHWVNGNDRLINTDNTSTKVWYRLQRIDRSINQSSVDFPLVWNKKIQKFFFFSHRL